MHTPHLLLLSLEALTVLEKRKCLNCNCDLIFVGDHDPRKVMSEGKVNKVLRVMSYDTKTEVCGMNSGRWFLVN